MTGFPYDGGDVRIPGIPFCYEDKLLLPRPPASARPINKLLPILSGRAPDKVTVIILRETRDLIHYLIHFLRFVKAGVKVP